MAGPLKAPQALTHEQIWSALDRLAERATALGGTAEGRLHAIAESSPLPRYPGEIVAELVSGTENLLERHDQTAVH